MGWPLTVAVANVSGWSSGSTPFTAGQPTSQNRNGTALYTALNSSAPIAQRAPTSYFQTTVQLSAEDATRLLSASFSFTVGDGIVVFVNGVEGTIRVTAGHTGLRI